MPRFTPRLIQNCPTCRSLYEYSQQPNGSRMAAPTQHFCSECGDLVADWSDDQIRVYIFVANSNHAEEAARFYQIAS